MNAPVAIEASVASLLLRCALAGWLSCWLLAAVDGRKSAWGYQLLLGLGTTVFSARALVMEEVHQFAWGLSAALALLWTGYALRQWLTAAPAEIQADSAIATPPKRSKRKGSKAARGRGASSGQVAKPSPHSVAAHSASAFSASGTGGATTWSPLLLALFAVGTFACLAALWPTDLGLGAQSLERWVVPVHLLASSVMLAVCLVTALELTVLSSPDSVLAAGGAAWGRLGAVALAAAVVEMLVCLTIFLEFTDSETAETEVLLAKRIFALAVLVSAVIAWLIPSRIAGFQKRGELATGWVSLTLASWIAALAFAVVCLLPPDWPLS